MPDSPSNDDQFADLFRKLPDPNQRGADGTAAPVSRREARAAAHSAPDAPQSLTEDPDDAEGTSGTEVAASPQGAATPSTAAAARDDAPLAALFVDDEHERERVARQRRDRRKSRIAGWVIFGVILAILGGLTAGGFAVWNTYEDKIRAFMGWEEPQDYEAGIAEGEVVVTIIDGDNGSSISQSLYEAGVTKTPTAFYDYLIDRAQNPTFLPGAYSLQQKMTSEAALAALLDPASKLANQVVVTEGMTAERAYEAIAASTEVTVEELEAAAADYTRFGVPAEAPSIEGYLFPATYTFDPGVTADQVLQRLVDETFARLDALGVAESDRFSVLTLAGLVQKESGPSVEDMHKIARVFLNRVDDGMLLQSDATVAYGAGIEGTVWTTDEERADESNLYNTYVHEGLPPGPISNPGEDAIEAAISPADGTWLYFVAVNLQTGETLFSDTYEQHLAAVAQMQEWCSVEANKPYCA